MTTLSELPLDQRRAFFAALLYISTIDGEVHEHERAFIEQALSASGLPDADQEAIRGGLASRPPIEDVLLPLVGTPAARMLVRELVSLAHADGVYLDAERLGVASVADRLGLDAEWTRAMESWVADGLAWRQRGEALMSDEQARSRRST